MARIQKTVCVDGVTFELRPNVRNASNAEWIRSVRLFNGHCEVRRGVADIPPGTSIAQYIGEIGRMLFSPDRLKLDFD